ncbi:MAG: glutamate racemase [Acidimicrobiia bacterium]|nr:glutamate racemase [Acidimicrobiia bacterium]
MAASVATMRRASVLEWSTVIGIFDSGVGGLTVWRHVSDAAPQADLWYLADQANVPYGPRPLDEVRSIVTEVTDRLVMLGASTVVMACHTASAAALEEMRQRHPHLSFVGLEPAIKPATEWTETGRVGVLATSTTLDGPLYARVVERYAGDVEVITRPAPELVTMVETGEIDPGTIEDAVMPLVDTGIDALVLGCTHFGFLADHIAAITGSDVRIIDPAPAVAAQVLRVADLEGSGTRNFETTGDQLTFVTQLERLLH